MKDRVESNDNASTEVGGSLGATPASDRRGGGVMLEIIGIIVAIVLLAGLVSSIPATLIVEREREQEGAGE
ncbi:MAG: hypothetical protein AAB579_02010 [Patescibacteria group bacterium]